MPTPRYIICSETRIIDRGSGLVTHINIIDGFVFVVSSKTPETMSIDEVPVHKMIASAVWMKLEDDAPDCEYEYQYLLHKPGQEPRLCSSGTFRFSRTFHRIEQGFLMRAGKDDLAYPHGVVVVENRIRPADSDEAWQSQGFPITVEVRVIDDAPVAEEAANSESS
jgi:hypothetical protein